MGTSDIALERIQALLKVDTGSGSLYDHVAKLAQTLAAEKPASALAEIEALSRQLKLATFRGAEGPDEAQQAAGDQAAVAKLQQWCADSLKLVKPPSDPLSAPKVLGTVSNFMEDAAMLEWAGVGFGKQESFHVAMSLRKLAADLPSLEKLRVWGKILGTGGDYYVAEGTLQAAPDGKPEPEPLPTSPDFDVERRGQGANTALYWVTAGGAAPWVRLPAARASHIVASRSIRRLLTGSLGSEVLSTPWFPGKERHLLRSQIARISATCTLAPSGFYEVDDEVVKNKLKEAEEFEFPDHETLMQQGTWVHAAPYLLSSGKNSWPDEEALAEKMSEAEVAALGLEKKKTDDPEHAMLEPIEADLEPFKPEDAEGSVAWSIKQHGDKGVYSFEPPRSHRVTAVRSLIWPGAVTVAQGSKFANFYSGYGLKSGSLVPPDKDSGLPLQGTNAFLPLAPGDIMDEPADLEEQEEPNPVQQEDESDKGDIDEEDAEA